MKLRAILLLLAVIALITKAGNVRAGTLCGTVRDGITNSPVPGAGVFVFHPGGAFAGQAAVTDMAGAFCIAAIPPGTYNVQVRVNDYLEKVIAGVVVTGDVSGVDVELGARVFLAAPHPNPARGQVFLGFELAVPAALVTLEVFDVAGRLVQGWRSDDMGAGVHQVEWSFDDRNGTRVAPGCYFVRLSAAGVSVTRRVVYVGP
ncbi:MAG TPA: carboxypeptidase regulatory-like domain-containing protein [Candidatus Eisenbacteria bacterium]